MKATGQRETANDGRRSRTSPSFLNHFRMPEEMGGPYVSVAVFCQLRAL